jgi:hypothetical protein
VLSNVLPLQRTGERGFNRVSGDRLLKVMLPLQMLRWLKQQVQRLQRRLEQLVYLLVYLLVEVQLG